MIDYNTIILIENIAYKVKNLHELKIMPTYTN